MEMIFCSCEKTRKFLLPKPDKRKANGDPWEACSVCTYPVKPLS